MKIVVIGGTGLIGRKLVKNLGDRGHEATPVSPSTGVDILTGAGLAPALESAEVVVDVTNSPSFEDSAVMSFFQTAARHLLPAEAAAGVRHHVALSVVGADRLPTSGYMRAKVAQEAAITSAGIPYTIVRATQFCEFVGAIADSATKGDTARLPSASIQPIASDDVAAELAAIAVESPVNGIVELGGPELFPMDELVRHFFSAKSDARRVVSDPEATYFGARLAERSLVAGERARLGKTRFVEWLRRA